MLHDDSPEVARLIDELTADAEVYMAQGVDTGLIKPSPILAAGPLCSCWNLGALAMNRHLERLLGVDLTALDADLSPYAGPILELYAQGLLTRGRRRTRRCPRINRAPAHRRDEHERHRSAHRRSDQAAYGDVKALIDLDLDVQRGEVFLPG